MELCSNCKYPCALRNFSPRKKSHHHKRSETRKNYQWIEWKRRKSENNFHRVKWKSLSPRDCRGGGGGKTMCDVAGGFVGDEILSGAPSLSLSVLCDFWKLTESQTERTGKKGHTQSNVTSKADFNCNRKATSEAAYKEKKNATSTRFDSILFDDKIEVEVSLLTQLYAHKKAGCYWILIRDSQTVFRTTSRRGAKA